MNCMITGVLTNKNRPFRFQTACFCSFLDRFIFDSPAFGAQVMKNNIENENKLNELTGRQSDKSPELLVKVELDG